MNPEAWVALGTFAATGLFMGGAFWALVRAKLDALTAQITAQGQRFDADLGRLNAKVDNDIHGRRAVHALQQRLTVLEVKTGCHETNREDAACT